MKYYREDNNGTNRNCIDWSNSDLVKSRPTRDMEKMGLHIWDMWSAVLVLFGMVR